MVTVGATTLVRNFGEYQDVELPARACGYHEHPRERSYCFRRMNIKGQRDRRVLARADFTADELAAIAASEAPVEAAQFNHEVK